MFNRISSHFPSNNNAILFEGSCTDFIKEIPDQTVKLVITSPPYNIGKEYEKKLELEKYYFEKEKMNALEY